MFDLIETDNRLSDLCVELESEKELAIDLEADSLHHYREKVCLIQISNRVATWLIDPLQVKDFTPLARLLANEQLLTVFHGGDYDIRSLYRDFEITVSNMFDTMIAAQFVGVTEFGLAALQRDYFGIELDKRFQKADWSKRPLTQEMSDYAADDTANLLRLADLLRDKLDQLGRSDWVAEECALVASYRMQEKGDAPLFFGCKGAGRLERRSLAILEELLQLRDSEARSLDRPPFKIMPAEALLIIAERQPDSVQDLNGISGMTPKLIDRYGSRLLTAVKKGASVLPDKLPRFPRGKGEPNHGIKAKMAGLKQWREGYSKNLQLASGLIAPNWLLERISEQQPKDMEQLAAIQGIRRWQIGLWGKEMLELLSKETQTA